MTPDAADALMLALDRDGLICLWNRRLAEVTGYTAPEMLGQSGFTLIGSGGVRPLRTRDGKELLVRWQCAAADPNESDQPHIYAIGFDAALEQEAARRALRAEKLAAVGTLAAGLAHEVRNPLNSALLQLAVLGRRVQRIDGAQSLLQPVLDLIASELRRLEQLVNEFLDFVHPQPLQLSATRIADLVGELMAFVAPEAEALGVTVRIALDETVTEVPADPARLRQVLLNLVRNALEAMPSGGTLTLRTQATASTVDIEVEDTGPGVPDETPIFDAFFTTKPQGTGLGLTVVHRIVSDHGGTVRVTSRPGCTRFTVQLPSTAPRR